MTPFIWPVRVYYEDTDSGGVVYHANYLKFMERARTEWLRSLGFEQDVPRARGVLFAVRSVTVDFLKPGYFNQLLSVTVSLAHCGRASLTFAQAILHGEERLCAAHVKIACLDAATLRPRRIPENILSEIACDP